VKQLHRLICFLSIGYIGCKSLFENSSFAFRNENTEQTEPRQSSLRLLHNNNFQSGFNRKTFKVKHESALHISFEFQSSYINRGDC